MKLPTFLIGGAQKSGTTTLHHYLSAHPDIFIPRRPQELHFFDFDPNYVRGVHWYASHFTSATPAHRAIGQTSPLYLYAPDAPERIAALLPDVKLIFIRRNPVDRAFSHYWHAIKKGRKTLDFETALAMEDLDRNTEGARDECARFLDIEPQGRAIFQASPPKSFNTSRLPRSMRAQRLFAAWRSRAGILTHVVDRLNLKRAAYPPMAEHVHRRLALEFQDDIARLEQLTGMSFESWSGRATRTLE
ncbi:MAG TPA: sulfotransferase [Vicinamibacterales bacterium]|nr:sulfotransferase [Vicinamibacterales bacterium]